MNIWKAILAALVIFSAGFVSGVSVFRLKEGAQIHARQKAEPSFFHWTKKRKEFVERLDQQLNLSDDQRLQVEAILEESQQEIRAMWERMSPEAREVYKNVRKRIESILTPEQYDKFQELMEKSRKHGHRKRGDKGEKDEKVNNFREGKKPC